MKFQDIKGLSATELKKKIASQSQEIFELKMKNSLGQLSNPIQIRTLRRELARMKTALVQKVVR